MIRILSADDRAIPGEVLARFPQDEYRITTASYASEMGLVLAGGNIDILILVKELPDGDGIDLLRRLKAAYPLVEMIMVVGTKAVRDAARSIKLGAYDCLTGPVKFFDLVETVNGAYEAKCLKERKASLSRGSFVPHELVGKSKQIRKLRSEIAMVGPSNVPVLILGETGTGKELVAWALHGASKEAGGPFVTVNAAGIPDSILENELFGHSKGAFTGAYSDKPGLIEAADQGTLFADEVGEICFTVQAKLLRVIETGTFRKLGDTRETKVKVRLVSATNKDLEKEVKDKTFRADLFYRLSTFIIRVPPLRERKEDIPLLVEHFVSKCAARGTRKHISSEALSQLMEYSWPGNVRELANIVERAVLLSYEDEVISADKFSLKDVTVGAEQVEGRAELALEDVGRRHVERVLKGTGGNKSEAARLLGISRQRLYKILGNRPAHLSLVKEDLDG